MINLSPINIPQSSLTGYAFSPWVTATKDDCLQLEYYTTLPTLVTLLLAIEYPDGFIKPLFNVTSPTSKEWVEVNLKLPLERWRLMIAGFRDPARNTMVALDNIVMSEGVCPLDCK